MLNNSVLMGRLTADPILRHTRTDNIPVISFSLAVDRQFSKGPEKETDFINLVAWRGTAEFINKYFTKGQPMCVKGRLQQSKWTDAEGNNRSAVEVVAESVFFAGFKREDSDTDFDPDEYEYANAA